MKYLPRLVALDTMESSFLGYCHHVEKTNDQSDLRVGRADRGSRIHNSGRGCSRRTPGPRPIPALRTVCGLQTSARLPPIPILYPLVCPIPLLMRSNSDKESGWRGLPTRLPWESAPVDAQSFSPPHRSAMHACGAHLGEDDPLWREPSPFSLPTTDVGSRSANRPAAANKQTRL
jgi:hypothetical protein